MGDAVDTGITDGFPFDPDTPLNEEEDEDEDPPGCDDTVSSVKEIRMFYTNKPQGYRGSENKNGR